MPAWWQSCLRRCFLELTLQQRSQLSVTGGSILAPVSNYEPVSFMGHCGSPAAAMVCPTRPFPMVHGTRLGRRRLGAKWRRSRVLRKLCYLYSRLNWGKIKKDGKILKDPGTAKKASKFPGNLSRPIFLDVQKCPKRNGSSVCRNFQR